MVIAIDWLIKPIKLSIKNIVTPHPVKVATNIKKKLGALAFSTSLLRLRNCSFSLLKVTPEFLLMIYGMPSITTHIAILKNVELSVSSIIKYDIKNPKLRPMKNIIFQKLSLFSLDFRKLGFGFLGLSYMPPYSLGVTNKVSSFAGKSLGFGMFSKLKSFTALAYNLWVYKNNIIIPKHYYFTKKIKAFAAVLPFIFCFNCSQVYAKNQQNVTYHKQHIVSLIAKAEKENQIPPGLLAAIAKVESGTKIYALNINGVAVFKESLEEASKVVNNYLALGHTNIDLGVMQLNFRWHGAEFKSIAEMLRPENNIRYAASLLKSLRVKHGNWHKAIRYYHSAKPEHHVKYSRKVVMCWLTRDRAG